MLSRFIAFLLLASASFVLSEVTVADGTGSFKKSTESEFDHEVTLVPGELFFHWNDANGNTLECRLIHKGTSLADAPSWLSVGFYDTFTNTEAVTASTNFMDSSDAVIGLVSSSNVQKYGLSGGDVQPLAHQTLVDATIKQHDSDDGTVQTILTFTKKLEETEAAEVRIRHTGENVFLWSMGSPGETAVGTYTIQGAFTIDLEAVKSRAEQGESGSSIDDGSGGATTDDSGNTAPVVNGVCTSELSGYDSQLDISSLVSFFWKIDGGSLKGALQYKDEAWVGFGVSAAGKMVGSHAIIGKPDESTADIYLLSDKAPTSITAAPDTSLLKSSSIEQDGGVTTLKFEAALNVASSDGHTITPTGLNTFIYAVGVSNEFGYHKHRRSFRIDLGTCDGSTKSHMGAFAAHGTIATLAWAIASPFAVTVAWFRTLVPSSWIYIHVFSNVMTFFLTLIAVIIAISAMSVQSEASHFSSAHHWVGLAMLVGITFQVMNGFLRPPVERKDPYASSHYELENSWIKLPRTPREVWYFSHRATGISLLAMGVYQIQSGLGLFAQNFGVPSVAPWYWAYVALFLFCLVGLKFWIMFEEYKARRSMEAMHVDHRSAGSMGGASDGELVPVQFDMS